MIALLLIIIIVLILIERDKRMVSEKKKTNQTQNHLSGIEDKNNESIEILKRRYARGEITTEEFKKMKKDLLS